jgi:hypothetical protein
LSLVYNMYVMTYTYTNEKKRLGETQENLPGEGTSVAANAAVGDNTDFRSGTCARHPVPSLI